MGLGPQMALPREVKHWSLTTLREKLIKIGAKVVSHAKAVTFQLAEVAVPRRHSRRFWSGSINCGRFLVRVERRGMPEEVTQRPTR